MIRPALLVGLLLAGCGSSEPPAAQAAATASSATPKAVCGPGSRPESTDMQGRVTQDDFDSGRTVQGITCNTEMVGAYLDANPIGAVGGYKVERYTDAAGHDCAYYDTSPIFPLGVFGGEAGVNVMDMSDPAHPIRVTSLVTPAMLSPHESLVVNRERGILAAVMGNPVAYPGIVDLYDVSKDCRQPVLKASLPLALLGHESGMSPDGLTFYASSPGTPTLTAIDITNPSLPLPLAVAGFFAHGTSISADGNRAYVAGVGAQIPTGKPYPALVILDVSDIQARRPNPKMREIARLRWDEITIPQNAMPFTRGGHPYLLEVDEFSTNGGSDSNIIPAGNGSRVGAARIIDIGDETRPKVISNLRLDVHQPENRPLIADDPGARSLIGGYAGHYCNVSAQVDPVIAACSMLMSGLRVFDIRDVNHPREVAYFLAPEQPHVFSLGTGNNALSRPSFVPERKEIWYSDSNNGFFVVRVTNGAWPD